MHFHMYIDDSQLEGRGMCDELSRAMASAVGDLKQVFVEALESAVAPDKEAIIASSGTMLRRLQEVLRPANGAAKHSATILGVEQTAGKRPVSAFSRAGRKWARWAKAKAKLGRLKALRAGVSPRLRRLCRNLCRTGVQSLQTWGAEVFGLDDRELSKVRAAESAMLPGSAFGGCRHARHPQLVRGWGVASCGGPHPLLGATGLAG